MKKVLLCLLLVLLFIPLLGMRAGPGEGITRCLLIGCDRFVSMPGTEPASANNVETMGALLSDFLPKGSVIRRTVNGPGTVEGFERLMTEVFRETDEADTSILYLSTHGLLKEVNEQQRMALLLSDGEQEERLAAVTVEERAKLAGIQPQRAPVILGGVVAVGEILAATGFDVLTVSESDLLFGMALTVAAAACDLPTPVGWQPELS